MEDESILGGLGTAWDAASDAVSAAGEAAYDVGAAGYHHAAGTADYFMDDMEGAAEHADARNEYMEDLGNQVERISDDVGVDGMSDAYDAGVDTVDAAGDAAYDMAGGVYHQFAGAADMVISDNEGAREHMDASGEYRADFDTQVERISENVGY